MFLKISYGISLILYLLAPVVSADTPNSGYQLGRGYLVGHTGLHLGGYASLGGAGPGSTPWEFAVNDLSLFVTWDNGSRLRFFSEVELEDVFVAGQDQDLTTKHTDFHLERLFLDYLINQNITLRIGKILTPIGQWNLIHADPLVWTSTRPVATENLFSQHATGIMLHGSLTIGKQSLDYAVYGDYSSSLDPHYTEDIFFDNAIGARVRYSITDNLKVAVSLADYALVGSSAIRNHLTGIDFEWLYQGVLVNSELIYRSNNAIQDHDLWQGYLQVVNPIIGKLSLVSRYEFFDQPNRQLGQVGVLGIAYRPSPPLVLKLEYRLGEQNRTLAPDGLFASFAVLF